MKRQYARLIAQVRLIDRGQCGDIHDRIAAKSTRIRRQENIPRKLSKPGVPGDDGDNRGGEVCSIEGI
jgi:hypothetical protein